MPTAIDFDTAAVQFARAADAIGSWPGGVRVELGDETVRGGALSTACVEVTRLVETTAVTLIGVLTDRAELCRRLADRCRAYESALADHAIAERTWRQRVAELTGAATAGDGVPVTLPPRPLPPNRPRFMT